MVGTRKQILLNRCTISTGIVLAVAVILESEEPIICYTGPVRLGRKVVEAFRTSVVCRFQHLREKSGESAYCLDLWSADSLGV